jgi:hypothetical protein
VCGKLDIPMPEAAKVADALWTTIYADAVKKLPGAKESTW